MRRPDAWTLARIGTVGAAIGIGIAIAPQLSALLQAAPAVSYPVRPIACPPPRSEFEQLHIVVVMRDGKIVADCQFFGSRGTYTGSARR